MGTTRRDFFRVLAALAYFTVTLDSSGLRRFLPRGTKRRYPVRDPIDIVTSDILYGWSGVLVGPYQATGIFTFDGGKGIQAPLIYGK